MARIEVGLFSEMDDVVVSKLHSSNIFNVYDFMAVACDDLMKKTGLSFEAIENIREQVYKNFAGKQINPVELYFKEFVNIISTGIKDLDNLLEGGLHCGQIYEICGSSSSGKSQLCHWISVNSNLNASTEVHYIDASSNFSVSRIQMILETQQCNDRILAKVMSNIKVYKVMNVSDLFTIFHKLAQNSGEEEDNKMIRIVIVDSLVIPFFMVPFNDLNSVLSNFASICRYIVNHCRAVVLTVNTVKFEDGGRTLFKHDKTVIDSKPSLSKYWMTVPNVRLLISSFESNKRQIAVWKSQRLENGKCCVVLIRDEGIFNI